MNRALPVVVVDDSAVQRRFLRSAIEACGEFRVVGEGRNGREAVALVERLRPTAVVLDLDLPLMGGVEVIERIMAGCATPILVYSAFVGGRESSNGLAALSAGAVDILAKPGPQDGGTLAEYAEELHRRLRVVARIRVITHPRGRLPAGGAGRELTPLPDRRPLRAAAGPPPPPAARAAHPDRSTARLVVLGASTGGPQALLTVLSALPADLEQAVLVVQHMADGFIPGLASWLDQLLALPVVVAKSGCRLPPGSVTIAPSGANTVLADARLRVLCTPPEPGQFHVPGIDAAMRSVAEALGPEAVGVLLTGMGRDGAAGLCAMRHRGAYTVAQDEASSAVYGMPAAAVALDAVDRQLPLGAIGPALCELLTTRTGAPG